MANNPEKDVCKFLKECGQTTIEKIEKCNINKIVEIITKDGGIKKLTNVQFKLNQYRNYRINIDGLNPISTGSQLIRYIQDGYLKIIDTGVEIRIYV